MSTQINVLIIEDSDHDARLLFEELRRGGFEPYFRQVYNEKDFRLELNKQSWDVIISDYNLPSFNGLEALEIIKQLKLEVPFILISGTVGEDIAVEAMKRGAQDYIMKDSFVRLVPALKRELADFSRRREHQKELQQKEDELRQLQKMEAIGQLAGGLAHDFNNILGVIGLYSEMITRTPDDGEQIKTCASEILKAQEKASKMVRQLLFLGRKQVLNPQVLDINSLIQNIENMLRVALGSKNKLVLKLDPAVPSVKVDSAQFEQVIMNLVMNARDAIEDGGTLTIATSQDIIDEGIPAAHLQVIDTGCGMDEDTRTKAFEPFFTTKKIGHGTGLGLSTVFGIVRQHGGRIFVESEKGKGSNFHILLQSSEAN